MGNMLWPGQLPAKHLAALQAATIAIRAKGESAPASWFQHAPTTRTFALKFDVIDSCRSFSTH